jgi:hypothetical protein
LKKLLFFCFGLAVVGMLAVSFVFKDLDKVIAKDEPKGETHTKADVVGTNAKSRKPIFPEESYQVDKDKIGYSSLENFVNRTYDDWQSNSEYRSIYADQDSADLQLSLASLHCINFFKNDIAKKGLTKQFDELQNAAYLIVNENGGGDNAKIVEATQKFGKTLREIYMNM